ncbi:hypothetical protein MMYC01_207029 [Madurella mycetomatis]|uniref:BTB domain-containing protein n=1 Tax=Madurella mycetomatis TaxID=100816 RepID=A0A175W1C7_9PEZI|nr:hypothetical protein MMYC01_207029 [Madurella mycetomatis]
MSGVTSPDSSGAAATTAESSGSGSGTGAGTGTGRGEESPSTSRQEADAERTLDDVMREPSTTVPDVVVLDTLPEGPSRKEALDPREDLWLSTADGRYSSPIIPLRVGQPPYAETFYVHKNVLLKSEYFEKALCGEFRESDTQSIDLPEEDPAIFHFLVAYLYEGRYDPIKPVASVLVPDQDKGKGHAGADTGADSDSDSASSLTSDISAVSRRRRERRRRREERHWERMNRKHPGMHRPNCSCPTCLAVSGPPCWSCRAPRNPPPAPGPLPHHHPGVILFDRDPLPPRPPRRHGGGPGHPPRRRHHPPPPPPPPPLTPPPPAAHSQAWDPNTGRLSTEEDLRTWLLAYELNLDVYILANKFLLEGFKREIARCAVDMLETAGSDAAVPQVLFLCRKLYDGLPESDPLLKMISARVAFLQPWRRAPVEETNEFWMGNPEIAPLLLREMAARREEEGNGRQLPSMVRPWYASGVGAGGAGGLDLALQPLPHPPPPMPPPAGVPPHLMGAGGTYHYGQYRGPGQGRGRGW